MDETSTLAKYLSELSFQDLPDDVVEMSKLCILDSVGVGLSAGTWPWSRIVAEQVAASGGAKEAVVWGRRLRVPAQQAALANGTAAHGIEMDDRLPQAQAHPGSMVVPAALALAEQTAADGQTLITAVVAGYELGIRVGYTIHFKKHGVHWAGHKGVWSAVGAASKALGLDHQQTLDAYGLAGSMACGLGEFSRDPRGTMVKRLHGGLAASHAVLAAQLGKRALTGPATILEGEYGYCNTYAFEGEPNFDELTRDLGSDFRILHREIKPYASWGGGHNAIDAVAKMLSDGPINVDTIAAIRIGGSHLLTDTHRLKDPQSVMAAQYSLPFLTALSLSRGPSALMDPNGTWTDETLADPVIAKLIARTEVYVDPEIEERAVKARHYGGARVSVELTDGTNREGVIKHSKGTRQNPVTPDEIKTKFRAITHSVMPESRAEEIIACIDRLDELGDVKELATLLEFDAVVPAPAPVG